MKKQISYNRGPKPSRFVEDALKRANDRAAVALAEKRAKNLKTNEWDSSISRDPQLFDPNIKKVEIFKPGRLNATHFRKSKLESPTESPSKMPEPLHDIVINNTHPHIPLHKISPTVRNDKFPSRKFRNSSTSSSSGTYGYSESNMLLRSTQDFSTQILPREPSISFSNKMNHQNHSLTYSNKNDTQVTRSTSPIDPRIIYLLIGEGEESSFDNDNDNDNNKYSFNSDTTCSETHDVMRENRSRNYRFTDSTNNSRHIKENGTADFGTSTYDDRYVVDTLNMETKTDITYSQSTKSDEKTMMNIYSMDLLSDLKAFIRQSHSINANQGIDSSHISSNQLPYVQESQSILSSTAKLLDAVTKIMSSINNDNTTTISNNVATRKREKDLLSDVQHIIESQQLQVYLNDQDNPFETIDSLSKQIDDLKLVQQSVIDSLPNRNECIDHVDNITNSHGLLKTNETEADGVLHHPLFNICTITEQTTSDKCYLQDNNVLTGSLQNQTESAHSVSKILVTDSTPINTTISKSTSSSPSTYNRTTPNSEDTGVITFTNRTDNDEYYGDDIMGFANSTSNTSSLLRTPSISSTQETSLRSNIPISSMNTFDNINDSKLWKQQNDFISLLQPTSIEDIQNEIHTADAAANITIVEQEYGLPVLQVITAPQQLYDEVSDYQWRLARMRSIKDSVFQSRNVTMSEVVDIITETLMEEIMNSLTDEIEICISEITNEIIMEL